MLGNSALTKTTTSVKKSIAASTLPSFGQFSLSTISRIISSSSSIASRCQTQQYTLHSSGGYRNCLLPRSSNHIHSRDGDDPSRTVFSDFLATSPIRVPVGTNFSGVGLHRTREFETIIHRHRNKAKDLSHRIQMSHNGDALEMPEQQQKKICPVLCKSEKERGLRLETNIACVQRISKLCSLSCTEKAFDLVD